MWHFTPPRRVALMAALLAATGCSIGGSPLDPDGVVRIRGTVEVKGGNVALLTGGLVEFESAADPTVKARSPIEDEGLFEATQVKDGRIQGVPPGQYKARVLPPSDGGPPVFDKKYTEFKTSGLTVTADGTTPVKLTVEKSR